MDDCDRQHEGPRASHPIEPPQDGNSDKCNDDAPKDLSIKTKKLKQIPPPLNLMTKPDPVNMLKDFAVIATSPKSPLMQKNLPFRKRAYSFSGVNDAATKPVLPPPTPTSSDSQEVPPSPSLLPVSILSCPGPSPSPSPRMLHPPDPIRHPSVLPPHATGMLDTSALLSPAPSSLGSSQEELNYSPNWSSRALPWQLPVWHCFMAGSRVRVDQLLGGCWQLAEDLAGNPSAWSPEWLLPLHFLEVIHVIRDSNEVEGIPLKISLQFSYVSMSPIRLARPWEGGVATECEPYHPFFVQEKGWCAVYPELVLQQYGFRCLPLERGDICLAPSKLPLMSPDICERFKRFSFPPEENGSLHSPRIMPPPPQSPFTPPHEGLLSPPSSPTKKMLDALRPKRPMNAFMLFAKKFRLDLIQKYPGKDNRAISVLLGEAWRCLPPPDREVYVQEARVMAQEQKRLHPDCWKRKRSHSTS